MTYLYITPFFPSPTNRRGRIAMTSSLRCRSGVPFITCEGQGMDDLIPAEDRHLWLCKPHDPVDLADKIAHFIAHRPVQRLSGPVSFDELIDGFMKRNLEVPHFLRHENRRTPYGRELHVLLDHDPIDHVADETGDRLVEMGRNPRSPG